MATKRKTKVIKVIKTQEVEEWWGTKQKIASLALLVVLFWYRTDSWPVVALVNNYPISRFELNQLMYKRVGQEALENLVVDKLIVQELAAKGVNVSDEEVNKKIEEIKTQIGSAESFEQALAIQGMTEEQLKGQIKIQLALEKLVEPSSDSAVLQERVTALVSSLRDKAVVRIISTSGQK